MFPFDLQNLSIILLDHQKELVTIFMLMPVKITINDGSTNHVIIDFTNYKIRILIDVLGHFKNVNLFRFQSTHLWCVYISPTKNYTTERYHFQFENKY